jgi:ubiquinone/menaquinone biosynthesis C-methylase UbiE
VESYDVFAPFYDAVQGDRADHSAYIRSLIEQHHPQARTLLEVACGTGSVLKQLDPYYEVTGVDRSEAMLEVARRKLPGVSLEQGDMTDFELGATFDVVLCAFDSINHLLHFEEWEAAFDRARAHLNDGGIYVFDVNTEGQLERFSAQPPLSQWFDGENVMVMDVTRTTAGLYRWMVRIFEARGGDDYKLHAEDVLEAAFPADRIESSLLERFSQVDVDDASRPEPSPESARLHFVCRR